ncbi:MAG: CRISPR-associated endonuclease Cas1, partial [Bacteroidales bacterium]
MVRKIENTLYITNPEAYVRKKHEVLIVEIDKEEVLRVPGHHLGSIIMFGNSGISHFAL